MAVTWDPLNINAGYTLSNGDLTITAASGSVIAGVATVGRDPADTDGWAIQFNPGPATTHRVGIGSIPHTLTTHVGETAGSYAARCGNTIFRHNATSTTGGTGFSSGQAVLVLIKNGGVYFYRWVTGAWATMKSGSNALTETNPIWSGASGLVYPMLSTNTLNDVNTIQGTPDSLDSFPGFKAWDFEAGGGSSSDENIRASGILLTDIGG